MNLYMNNFVIILLVILVLIKIFEISYFEMFENTTNNDIKIYVFVSKTCPHCVNYVENKHKKIEENYSKTENIKYELIYANDDKDKLFDKYQIEYVPACVIINKNNAIKLNNEITKDEIEKIIKTL